MIRKEYVSVFRRKPSTYEESPFLKDWICADKSNPLNQISNIIAKGKVLDIGCGSGILGRLLSHNPKVIVDGVDPAIKPGVSGLAVYSNFYPSTVEALYKGKEIEQYDWLVLADVIEHFPYPDEMLAELCYRAKPTAKFLLSTPNITYFSIRITLANGQFNYEESGILESTHLRFFTLDSLITTLNSAGLKIDRVLLLNRMPSFKEIYSFGWFRTLIYLFTFKKDKTLFTYQFLVEASSGIQESPAKIESIGNANFSLLLLGTLSYLGVMLKEVFRKLI